MTVTVAERKALKVARLRSAADRVMDELKCYAVEQGGRFAVFGSFARGDIIHTSDFDVMVEFPSTAERAAALRAEAICRAAGLDPDVHLASESSDSEGTRRAGRRLSAMSDARWLDVDDDVEAASTHFRNARALYANRTSGKDVLSEYRDAMALMHACSPPTRRPNPLCFASFASSAKIRRPARIGTRN